MSKISVDVPPNVYEFGGVYFEPKKATVNYRGETKVLSGFALDVVRTLFDSACKPAPVVVKIGPYTFDPVPGKLCGEGVEPLKFTKAESGVFLAMARRLGTPVSMGVLRTALFNSHDAAHLKEVTLRAVDVHVWAIRKKLKKSDFQIEIGTRPKYGRTMSLTSDVPAEDARSFFEYTPARHRVAA